MPERYVEYQYGISEDPEIECFRIKNIFLFLSARLCYFWGIGIYSCSRSIDMTFLSAL